MGLSTRPSRAAAHIPPETSKAYKLLALLLEGQRVDPFFALMEMNLPTVNARVSELRKMGWPIRSIEQAHPKLAGERVVVYFLDRHFRDWMRGNPGTHPGEYPSQEGRGKFADWTPEQFREGEA